MTELTWETLDLDAPWPETVHRAKGAGVEYRINHYIPARDKKFDDGPKDLWSLATYPISCVSYHRTLEAAQREAHRLELITA